MQKLVRWPDWEKALPHVVQLWVRMCLIMLLDLVKALPQAVQA